MCVAKQLKIIKQSRGENRWEFATYVVWSFRVASSWPATFHRNTEPSAAPAAIFEQSGLKATRAQSQPTLKLSWLKGGVQGWVERPENRETPMSTHLNVPIIWFCRKSNNLIVSSRTQQSNSLQSFDKSSDVIFPCSVISLEEQSVRVSQKRIFLSKCPLIIVEPEPSDVTRSLQHEPANLVSVQARLRRSQILRVRSWLPVTTLACSPRNFAASTLPLWPVKVCCKLEIK